MISYLTRPFSTRLQHAVSYAGTEAAADSDKLLLGM